MKFFLVLTFLFYVGSLLGWEIELWWRKFFSKNNPEHKWINPGFLTGPYLPLYGFCLVILFCLSYIDVSFIENEFLRQTALFVCMALSITVFEYIAGLIFIKGMKIKLWDYSKCWGNIQGIICPQYTLFWYMLSAVYYFFIHPQILDWLFWFVNHIEFSFVVGFFYGVFCIDLCSTFKVMTKIRRFAKENSIIVGLTKLQKQLAEQNDERKKQAKFWFIMKAEQSVFGEKLSEYMNREKPSGAADDSAGADVSAIAAAGKSGEVDSNDCVEK